MSTGSTQPSALEVLTSKITESVLVSMSEKMASNNTQLMEDMKSLLAESTPDISERASKRLKMDNPDLSRPGNRDQYVHNTEVLRTINKAANCVLKADGEGAIANLREGKKIIENRQKLIRLADREERGWAFVREYTMDTLADNSDDEKRLRKARSAVKEKFAQQNKRNQQSSRGNFRRQQSFRNNSNDRPRDHQYSSSSSRSNFSRGASQPRTPQTDFRRDRYDRECFYCKQRGHLTYDCPSKRQRGQ